MRYARHFCVVGLLLLCCGCAILPAGKGQKEQTQEIEDGGRGAAKTEWRIAGTVEAVDKKYGYVVIECEIMPPAGAEAQVYRGQDKVGKVEFQSRFDPPYYTADILDGKPRKGDLVVY